MLAEMFNKVVETKEKEGSLSPSGHAMSKPPLPSDFGEYQNVHTVDCYVAPMHK